MVPISGNNNLKISNFANFIWKFHNRTNWCLENPKLNWFYWRYCYQGFSPWISEQIPANWTRNCFKTSALSDTQMLLSCPQIKACQMEKEKLERQLKQVCWILTYSFLVMLEMPTLSFTHIYSQMQQFLVVPNKGRVKFCYRGPRTAHAFHYQLKRHWRDNT